LNGKVRKTERKPDELRVGEFPGGGRKLCSKPTLALNSALEVKRKYHSRKLVERLLLNDFSAREEVRTLKAPLAANHGLNRGGVLTFETHHDRNIERS